MDALTPHPEAARLAAANSRLRDELAALLAREHELHAVVSANVQALYQSRLGPWELRRIEAECEAARMRRRMEMVQEALNAGQAPVPQAIEARLDADFDLWRRRMDEVAQRVRDADSRLAHLLPRADADELRRLYRDLVKRLHPDVNPALDAEQQRLWPRVLDAYASGNLEALRGLALVSPAPPPADTPPTLERLRDEAEYLKARVAAASARIAETEGRPPLSWRSQLEDDAWVDGRRRALEEEIAGHARRRDAAASQLKLLLASHGYAEPASHN